MIMVIDKGLDFLETIASAKGTNAKKEIIKNHIDCGIVSKILKYAFNPYIAFNVVKIPKTKERQPLIPSESWMLFFESADKCSKRKVTGNAAISLIRDVFSKSSVAQERWMRKILKKNLAIGVSVKSINKVSPGFIPTFDVALAQKFDIKRIKSETIAVEPKLDGIRCEALVKDGVCTLYARSGKQISNFDDTIGTEIAKLPDGCYEGEIMGEDFTALMRQAYRKEGVDTAGTYLALFDYIPLDEWKSKKATMTCFDRYKHLEKVLGCYIERSDDAVIKAPNFKHVRLVFREYIRTSIESINHCHDRYVAMGYEGLMVKDKDAPYSFSRDWSVMKYKAFFDADVPIVGMQEGTGKHKGKLGSFLVDYKGVEVRVGSGLTDELREQLWVDPEAHTGRIIEVRYQEETPDGSLRFPTFVCFRNDKL